MKYLTLLLLTSLSVSVLAQERVRPLMYNPYLQSETTVKYRTSDSTNLDSTFVYQMDTLDVPIWDDFSINKWHNSDADYSDANVSGTWYYYLMDATNTFPLAFDASFCDSANTRHDSVIVTGAITDVYTNWDGFTAQTVNVNDLCNYPVVNTEMSLFQECYVLIDSLIDGVPDPDQDTIYITPIFVQDSAHIFTVDVDQQNEIWLGRSACHNYRFPVDPWSLGVATFDGTDSSGMPYNFGNPSAHEKADVLTSKHVNLNGESNVYLTFIYQAGGYGNTPDAQDSLIVDFWLVDSSRWYTNWTETIADVNEDEWDTAHIPIPIPYLEDGFRFRFRNWASTSAALDHWHIDYVSLEADQLPTVDAFNDLAISYPLNSFIKDYTAVPWDHFRNLSAAEVTANMVDASDDNHGSLKVYNSAVNPSNYADGGLEISHEGVPQGLSPYTLPNTAGSGWTGNYELGQNTYPYANVLTYEFDNTVDPDPQATFDIKINIATASVGQNIYPENDTNWIQQKFDNYYSYDDGTAESAYELLGSNSELAYQFTAYELDTLTGVLMHFVPWVNDMSTSIFLLTVWEDDGGVPGDIIYQDDFFDSHTPKYEGSKNGFVYYDFTNDTMTVDVPGEPEGRKGVPLTTETFYVGWEQIDAEGLMIGLDWNIDNGDKVFRNVGGGWTSSSFEMSLLMRPVFSTALNYTLNLEEQLEEIVEINMYPNPTENQVFLSGTPDEFELRVFDMSGRLVHSSQNETTFDMSFFDSGIYLVDIRSYEGESLYNSKLIKR